jgi:tRNA/rRNA methyltransferase
MTANNSSTEKINYSLTVVLVRPTYASNIGSTSRAMSNMGVQRLILIDPNCKVDYSAQQAAATGQQALQSRSEYANWQEFYEKEPEGVRIALTARDGRGRNVRDLQETLEGLSRLVPDQELREAHPGFIPAPHLYFFYGTESCGLSAEDLENMHFCCSIPTYGENPSLNLAHAAMLSLFIFRSVFGGTRREGQELGDGYRPVKNAFYFPEESLRLWLETMGFNLSKRMNVFTVLRRMLLHNVPTAQELRILETVIQQTIRRLKGDKVKHIGGRDPLDFIDDEDSNS